MAQNIFVAKKQYSYKEVIIYRSHAIQAHPIIKIRVSQTEMKKFIDAKEDLGLSAREVLEYSGQPCECCKNTNVIIYNKHDEAVEIKRGILKRRKNG